MSDQTARRSTVLTIGFCYLAAILEGMDLQSMGIAGPKLMREFHLTPAQFGNAASLGPLGLLFGALIGGRLADRFGRKKVLVWSFVGLGLATLLTSVVRDYHQLLVARLLVGLGLGGAFPNLVALASEAAKGGGKATPISLMYAGIPMGTVISTLTVLYFGDAFQWRWIFYMGGWGPLILAPFMLVFMPESTAFKATAAKGGPSSSIWRALVGEGRLSATLLLWVGFFFTLLVVYLLTNWLNQLMASRGLDTAHATTVLLAFGVGSIAGGLSLGALTDTRFRRWTAVFAYVGIAAALTGLSQFKAYPLLVASGFGAGFFAVGAQLLNYALAPLFYPVAIRGTGVGWAVAVGRAGSTCGPLFTGLLLQSGLPASMVLIAFLPGLVFAAVSTSILLARTSRPAPSAPSVRATEPA